MAGRVAIYGNVDEEFSFFIHFGGFVEYSVTLLFIA